MEEGIAVLMRVEQAACNAPFGLAADSIDDPAVEAFDEAIGLGSIGPGEAVLDTAVCAKSIERVPARWFVLRLVLHIDGEAVSELGAIVG